MDFGEKLQQIIEYVQLKPSSFAKEIAVDKAMISKYLNAGNQPTYMVLSNILTRFPEISAEWLMRDAGEMLLNGSSSETTEYNYDSTSSVVVNDESTIDVHLEYYKKDNARLESELYELKNKVSKLEALNERLQNKLLELI